jgi:predicted ATPase/class 3 adenylate cyclase
MGTLPSGTVTFLLTDIEDSSTKWEQTPGEMRDALAIHDSLVAEAIATGGGTIVKHMGDGCWAAFDAAPAAARAAVDIQQRLQREPAEVRALLRVRIGLHTGNVRPTDGDYFGPVPNRSARVADLANGGQIVCSAATAGLLSGFELHSEGAHLLRGIGVEEVFLLHADGVEPDPRPLRRAARPTNLPRVPTSFLGRHEDVQRAISLLDGNSSVVTMLGPGGVGKTRLAIEVGEAIAAAKHKAVQFCDLAPVGDAEAVVASIADQVGARQQAGMDLLGSIADYVAERQLLLIFDNCEHVVDVVASIVDRLAAADEVTILATSRSALGVHGEQLMNVQPLAPATAGVELFVSRAKQHDVTFELTDANEAAVREIAQRLDGIPLAIELAAARIRLMTPEELVGGLDDRFHLLGGSGQGNGRDALRETVQWSYQMLSPQQAAVFIRMSVFAGGAALATIAAVCTDDVGISPDDIPDVVLALVDKSMVVSSVEDGVRRFSLLETMRSFGDEELIAANERSTYRRRHADQMLALAHRENDRLFTPAEPDAWRVLDQEWDNLRVAFDTYQDGQDADASAELVVALAWYASFAMRSELFTWASELLDSNRMEGRPAFTDLCGIAALGEYLMVSGRVTERAEAGLAANPSDPGGFCRLALAAVFLNNTLTREASEELTSAWLESPKTIGSRLWAEGFRTFYLSTYGLTEEATKHAAATARIAEETGSISAKALASWTQGLVLAEVDIDAALDVWTDGLEWPRSMQRYHLVAPVIDGLILHFTVERAELGDALRHCRDAVQAALDQHYYVGASHLFGVTAIALARCGDAQTGAKLVGSMIANGHRPRGNARRALAAALGDGVDGYQAAGSMLSVSQAGRIAVTALDAALAGIEGTA